MTEKYLLLPGVQEWKACLESLPTELQEDLIVEVIEMFESFGICVDWHDLAIIYLHPVQRYLAIWFRYGRW